ncbi:hypothetical protein [Chromobacterium haemolyticum]|uniref:hypothetical protein n=1 Tax=Chromobacterium haemolyticum TaxID=394935 RepID=UPI000DEF726A|nr:hypothetical protein [Chromobacterium haemolyticum]
MAAIKAQIRTVYYSPTGRRSYLTAKGAANAEASRMLSKKYPQEQAEYDDFGRITYAGFHWSGDEHLLRVHARLSKLLLKKLRACKGGMEGEI